MLRERRDLPLVRAGLIADASLDLRGQRFDLGLGALRGLLRGRHVLADLEDVLLRRETGGLVHFSATGQRQDGAEEEEDGRRQDLTHA